MHDLHSLLLNWQSIDSDIHELEMERHNVEQDIAATMKKARAEYVEAPGVQATLKATVEWEKDLDGPFRQVAELLNPDELEECLTAPKPAPARSFDVRKMKQLAKLGGIYKDALDQAARDVPARLRVRSVE